MSALTDRQVADRYNAAIDDVKALRTAPREARERAADALDMWWAEADRRGICALLWD